MSSKAITLDNINPNIVKMDDASPHYSLVPRAAEIEKELQMGVWKPFNKLIRANVTDAHAMGQVPITFVRQVLACLCFPELMKIDKITYDVKKRAQNILEACAHGSSSASLGIELIRKHVAEYIEIRDGHKANWENIWLIEGSGSAIEKCMQLLCKTINGKPSGVLIPIPQYPLYSAILAKYGLSQVVYYLDEENNWSIDIEEIKRAMNAATDCVVRAIVIINPGNPTGQVLTRKNIEAVIQFACKHKLFILADEVYQENIYDKNVKFYSFKKVMTDQESPYNNVELASYMTVSKGYLGEAGMRGGWMELCNLDEEVQAYLYKSTTATSYPSVLGQAVVDCLACPPLPDEPSYDLFIKQKTAVLESLKARAKMCTETFNDMQGFQCNVVQGAIYAFPKISLSEKAIEAAKNAGKPADVFYTLRLLEETGICVVAGSDFGQRPGTFHLRTTILPQPELLQEMLDSFQNFHSKFTSQYNWGGKKQKCTKPIDGPACPCHTQTK